MQQYHDLLRLIKEKGTIKEAARPNMPSTKSIFGHQMRFDLSQGFPILTTKKVSFKHIAVELLWFLRGDTNIKYLKDNGFHLWDQDAYNYYLKQHAKHLGDNYELLGFDQFVKIVANSTPNEVESLIPNYNFGDCGKQYGWLWRNWDGISFPEVLSINTEGLTDQQLDEFRAQWQSALQSDSKVLISDSLEPKYISKEVDQIKELVDGLKDNPLGRRHIITAWNPATLDQMALNACHAFVQFNCRPIYSASEKDLLKSELWVYGKNGEMTNNLNNFNYERIKPYEHVHTDLYNKIAHQSGITPIDECVSDRAVMDQLNLPNYYLDCQLYQRSGDAFLGVPYNISSYALLTHILAEMVNMVPGDFIHTFGDVHIYENHNEAVDEILTRDVTYYKLPTLMMNERLRKDLKEIGLDVLKIMQPDNFWLENYQSYPAIKAELSTGLVK